MSRNYLLYFCPLVTMLGNYIKKPLFIIFTGVIFLLLFR